MAEGLDLSRFTPEQVEFFTLQAQLRAGNAQPIIERYFKIKDVHGVLVSMKFTPLQRKYHDAMFGGGWKPGQPRDGTWVKARKALMSSWATAEWAAAFFWLPGNDVAVIANSDKTLNPLSLMVDTFYENLPDHVKPEIYKQTWGKEQRQIAFRGADGQTIINTTVMSSSNSPNFGRGFTIKYLHRDEFAYFVPDYDDSSLLNSLAAGAIKFNISTANGQDLHFHPLVQSAKRRDNRSQVYGFFPWWENPENWYGAEDDNARSEDWGKSLTPGVIDGTVQEQELARSELLIAESFPSRPGMSRVAAVAGYLRFRRRKMQDALRANAMDPRAAETAFYREYPEDDVRPFLNLVNPIFDSFLLEQQLKQAEREIVLQVEGIPQQRGGLQFRAYRRPVPGHTYAGAVDYSAMKGRDAAPLLVKDISTGEYVAEFYGNEGNSVPDVTDYACLVMTAYNHGMLIPETNAMGRTQGDYAVDTLGYKNVYRREARAAEDRHSKSFKMREYGWETTTPSRRDMIVAGQARFNSGHIKILDADLLKDMRAWNPEQPRDGVDASKRHFPDRLSCFFMIEAVNPPAAPMMSYGAELDPTFRGHPVTLGRGGRMAAPFPHYR